MAIPMDAIVIIECRGPHLTSLLNRARQQQITLENIRWIGNEQLELSVSVAGFYQLRPLIKSTQTKIRIKSKKGLPFLLFRLQRRKGYLIGIVLFFFILYALSSFVWKVEIEGNEKVPRSEILQVAREQGIFPGQLQVRMPSSDEIQYQLKDQLPSVTWIGFRMEGTRAIITVVEKESVREQENEEKRGPVHLIARRDAYIYEMRVKSGRPEVEVRDMVKKGERLVSGIYGNPEDDAMPQTVVGARGKVWGEVWYESEVTVPLAQKRKVYTGKREKGYYPYIGSTMIQIPFISKVPYEKYETIQKLQTLRVQNVRIPIGWVEEERLEMEWVKQELTEKEARLVGVEQARADVREQIGQDGRILEQKVLHQRVDNGKVYMKIHFDVVENIATPEPILQGE
ncbi:sporulation protein YqfD [Mechercharimyces sp. CAU 1602]|uniref:sporulation protein YqfD n=1 Tax=Mechercharimyces sp. CAU 1602 TaxID=2973933 RepID=UPI002162754A|nr:sporulation protein YqfD [Mechercharimyces sp. CAU 1602]MCS1350470.1 sporulation protein YqfD [Mechercharimyces sp. CAU 1602]